MPTTVAAAISRFPDPTGAEVRGVDLAQVRALCRIMPQGDAPR